MEKVPHGMSWALSLPCSKCKGCATVLWYYGWVYGGRVRDQPNACSPLYFENSESAYTSTQKACVRIIERRACQPVKSFFCSCCVLLFVFCCFCCLLLFLFWGGGGGGSARN